MAPETIENLSGRVTTVEHALFGVGGHDDGVLAEVRGLRQDIAAAVNDFKTGMLTVYRLLVGGMGVGLLAFITDRLASQ